MSTIAPGGVLPDDPHLPETWWNRRDLAATLTATVWATQRIRALPVLHTASGHIALLFAICRYLWTIGEGSDLDRLEGQLRAEGPEILSCLASNR